MINQSIFLTDTQDPPTSRKVVDENIFLHKAPRLWQTSKSLQEVAYDSIQHATLEKCVVTSRIRWFTRQQCGDSDAVDRNTFWKHHASY